MSDEITVNEALEIASGETGTDPRVAAPILAAEVKRLRDLTYRLESEVHGQETEVRRKLRLTIVERDSLRAEVERLQSNLDAMCQNHEYAFEEVKRLRARVQRLEAVWEASKEWRAAWGYGADEDDRRLALAIDAAQEQDK